MRISCADLLPRSFFTWVGLGLSATLLSASPADTTIADSGTGKVSLVELYSSEGCSSCPPAERWLGKLVDAPGLWSQFVPVEFHVDYWDGLGWKDPYASATNTGRQQQYATEWNASNVYTPEFVLNGVDWRSSWGVRSIPAPEGKNPGRLHIVQVDAKTYRAIFQPMDAFSGGEVYLAPLGFDRVSEVARGENAGATLRHQFIALRLEKATLIPDAVKGKWTATVTLPMDPEQGRLAVAAWISTPGSQVPLQAAGGWVTLK